MVPVMSRLVAHGTWHMPPRKGLQFVGHGLLRAMYVLRAKWCQMI